MNVKQAKQFWNKAVGAVARKLKSTGHAKEATTFTSKANSAVGKFLPVAKDLLLVNLVDQYMYDIPVLGGIINAIVEPLAEGYAWLHANTIGKIPGVGPWLYQNIGKPLGQVIAPRTTAKVAPKYEKYINDPKYYANTDMHQAWSIPFNFPDTDLMDYGSGIQFGSVAVIEMAENYLADQYAIESRTNQVFDLLKGIRGLSGKQPYSTGDLFYYHHNCEYIVNEYCRLKFALRLAQVYILTKSRMPINLLTRLGWDAEDLMKNRALYTDALTDLGNFITNNVPMYGVQIKRIYGLWEHLLPDSNDGKTALFYKVNLHYHTVVPQSNGTFNQYGDAFTKGSNLSGGAINIRTDSLRMSGMTYSTYVNQMLAYISEMNSNDQFNPIRADIIASFGKSSIWTDSSINQVCDTKYDDLIGPFDELFLSQIQNATILKQRGCNITSAEHGSTLPATINQLIILGTQNADGSFTFPSANSSNNNNVEIRVTYQASNTSGTAGELYLPHTDGAAYLNTTNSVLTDSTAIISNKYNMKENEQIELVQLLAFVDQAISAYSADGYDLMYVDYLTNTFYVEDIDVLYFDPVLKQDRVQPLSSSAILVGASFADYATVRELMHSAQFWSQADYGPKLSTRVICTSDLSEQAQHLFLDFNIMGTISKAAYKQEIRYSAYSLNAADIKITEAKKLNNIVNVYTMK